MARTPLPIGSHGVISVMERGRRDFQARCRFRGFDGVTRLLAANGATKKAAKNALQDKIRDRTGYDTEELKPHSRFEDAARLWMVKMQARRRGSTVDTYRRWLTSRVLPDMGAWRLREISVGRLDTYLAGLEQTTVTDHTTGVTRPRYSANSLRSIRKVISGPLQLAVKHEAIKVNPVHDMDEIEGQAPPPRALTVEERRRLRTWLRGPLLDDMAQRAAQLAARRRHLPDLVDFMLGTGVRVGEALAVRWCDLDLDGVPVASADGSLRLAPVVTISGNIVRVTGRGLVRHGGKTAKAVRTFELPRFVVAMLRVRKPDVVDWDSELPVFAATGAQGPTWRDPNNMQRYIREMRDALGWSWMTSHNWRETAITIWSDSAEMTDRATSDLAGHADITFTKKVYVGRGELNPHAAAVQDAAYADD